MLKRARFQFTLARMLASTTLVAMAAWVTTVELPVHVSLPDVGRWNLLNAVAAGALLAAAVGVLVAGKPGAAAGARLGCVSVLAVLTVLLPLWLALRAIIGWLG
jgi:hypothetical protein